MYNQGGGQQGEYALYSWMGPVTVPAPAPMTPPTSANATTTFGLGWAPTVSGGEGMGAYVYCVTGQTNFAEISTPWTPPAVGAYTFNVGQLPDGTNAGNVTDPILGEMEVNSTPYVLTVNPAQIGLPTSANATISVGQSWTPSYFGGTPGAGPFAFAVSGQTNFGSSPTSLTGSWTPATAGSYTFWVGQQDTSPDYSGNATDPNIGPIEVNPAPYTVTVSKASQNVVSTDAVLIYGQSFTPAYYQIGGSGSGLFQFCIVGYTNFNGGATSDTGTSDPANGNTWESSWPTPPVGTYEFMVAEDGNAAFNPANPGTYYTLTVNPANPPTVTISPSSSSVEAGDSVAFAAANGLNGYAWSVNPAGPAGISGNGASQTITFPAAGSYAVSVYSPAGGNYAGSNTATALISVNTPQYTLTTMAVGDGSVTAGGAYPANTILEVSATPGANATFAGWTGSLSSQSNPLSVTLTGNLTLIGNFDASQSQTIAFAPPGKANYPGPPIPLTATATSGLPVSFTVLSGPASLSGSLLNLTGIGPVAVQASQSGNSAWLPATPVIATINAGAPPALVRFRFNAAGHDATKSAWGAGASSIWTDATGLQSSPWPSFESPAAAIPGDPNAQLPAVPPAPPLSP
jgi:plastocyanin